MIFPKLRTLQSRIALVSLVLAPLLAPLQSLGVPSTFSIQGRIVRPDGRVLEASSVEFKVRVLTPDSNACILYEETQIKDLSGSGGLFSLTLNDGSGARSDGLGHAFEKTFSNQSAFNIPSTQCGSGSGTVTYTPSSSDERRVIIYFKEAGAGAWEQMPSMRLSSSTYALESQEALKLGGFAVSNMCRVVDGSGSPATATPLTVAQFAELLNVASGNYAKKEANGTTTLSSVSGNPASGLSAGQIWYDSSSNVLKYYDGSVKTVGTSGGSVTSVGAGAGLLGGPITTSGTLSVDVGTSAGQIVQVQTGGKLPVLDGSNLTNVVASNGYVNGGNSFAANASLGTNDAFTLGFKTNNATRMTIDSAGNVGIGTAVPAASLHIPTKSSSFNTSSVILGDNIAMGTGAGRTRLQLGNTSGISELLVGQDATHGLLFNWTYDATAASAVGKLETYGGNNPLILQSVGGNVGIGTTSPNEKLVVAGNVVVGGAIATTELYSGMISTQTPVLLEINKGSASVSGSKNFPVLSLVSNQSGTNDIVGSVAYSNLNIGSTEKRLGQMYVYTDGAVNSGRYVFATANAGVIAERMRITSAGNVGIGTTSPGSKLDVNGQVKVGGAAPTATNFMSLIVGQRPANDNFSTIRFGAANGARGWSLDNFDDGTSAQYFQIYDQTHNEVRMKITDSGNVGIGTTSPVSKLQVGTAPTVTANYPLFALGTAPFDGVSAGFFTGNSNGTFIGVNAATGYTGDFANFQIDGVSKYKIDHTGNLTVSGTTTSTGNISTRGHISTTGAGTITSAGALLANSGTASTSPTSGSLIVTGGAGISGALNVGSNVIANGNIATVAPIAATSGANQSSPLMSLTANYWNGTASAVDQWSIQNLLGAGANPSSTLTFSHFGSAGPAQYSFLNGNVGVGTTTPATLLDVNGSSTFRNTLNLSAGNSISFGNSGPGGIPSSFVWNLTNDTARMYASEVTADQTDYVFKMGDNNTADRFVWWMADYRGAAYDVYPMILAGEYGNFYNGKFYVNNLSGNVGVGTTSPRVKFEVNNGANTDAMILATSNENNRLVVKSWDTQPAGVQTFGLVHNFNGSDANGFLKFYRGGSTNGGFVTLGTNGAERLRIDSGGNVGIGTASPYSKLHVSGGNLIVSADGTYTNTYSKPLYIAKAGVTEMRIHSTDNNGDTGILFQGAGERGNIYADSGYKLKINSNNAYASGAVYINNSDNGIVSIGAGGGKVGVGTTAPSHLLHVNGMIRAGNGGSGLRIYGNQDGTSATHSYLEFFNSGSRSGYIGYGDTLTNDLFVYNEKAGALRLFTGNSEAMRIASAGNVGIGTSNPTQKLDVNGNIVLRPSGTPTYTPPISEIYTYSDPGAGEIGMVTGSGNALSFKNTWGAVSVKAQTGLFLQGSTILMSGGNIGVGTTSPAAKLDITDTGTTTSAIIVPRAGNFTGTTANGMIRYNTTSNLFEFFQNGVWVNYTAVSDGRLKTHIEPVTEGLSLVNQLNPVFFDWDRSNPRTGSFGTQHQVGFIAQEVEKVLPEVVHKGEDGYRSVEYGKIVSVVVAAVQELSRKVVGLDRDLASVKTQVSDKADKAEIIRLRAESADDIRKLKTENEALKAYICSKDQAAPFCR